MKIYTKTGDDGQTGLLGGVRVSKDDARIEAYGTVDELNAFLGHARAVGLPSNHDRVLARVQSALFTIGAQLATPDPAKQDTSAINGRHIEHLERSIDQLDEQLPQLKQFILPGGSPAAAALHLARVTCRRAERRVVSLVRISGISVRSEVIVYLNRLSDLLFVLARAANQEAGLADVTWDGSTDLE